MTKYITVAALLAAGTAFANAAIVFDFGGSLLPEGTTTTSLDITKDGISVNVAAKGQDGSNVTIGAGSWTDYQKDYQTDTVGDSKLGIVTDMSALFGSDYIETAKTYISVGTGANKAGDFVITFTGLTHGGTYDIGILSGLPFEGGGNWNSVVITNQYDEEETGSLVKAIGVKNTVSGLTCKSVIADEEGKISLKIDGSGYHTAALNGLAIVAVPEPSAFGLLAGIGALALVASRRRRK